MNTFATPMETLPLPVVLGATEGEAATDAGRVRESNEDRFALDEELQLFLVADGMGGHIAGEVAAQMAIELLPQLLRADLRAQTNAETHLQRALENTSTQVLAQSKTRVEWTKMGTTLVALWIHAERALIAHIGDSRAYLWRRGAGLKSLTTDHTLVELLVESGDLRREEAASHPMRHQITRFCGMEGEVVADVSSLEIRSGDCFLLCSDGVSGELNDGEIERLIQEPDAAKMIVEAAVEAGGRDNATALVVRVL